MSLPRLLGDLGGTNARFALLDGQGEIVETKIFRSMDFETVAEAIDAFIVGLPADWRPNEAALAIAGPVTGDTVSMLNGPWSFSIDTTRKQFNWNALHAVNDFAANALAVPQLGEDHVRQIGEGSPVADAPVAVLGPGTGLGVAGLVPHRGRWIPVAGEGGHATLAAMDSREAAIIDILRRQYAHVSAERVLSGPGLINLYDAMRELAGRPAAPVTPEYITNLYPGCDPQSRETVLMFCAMLGTFASSLALTLGARGGVYIMGGIVPDMVEIFRLSAFRERFEFKGRYRAYLSAIPTYVVMHPFPAFLGLKTLFDS